MSTVTGTVEAVSTKFGKFSVLMDGTWYATKAEWAPNPLPSSGDNVEFDDGGAKFIKKLRIIGSGGGSKSVSQTSGKKGFSTLGVELGHAANLGMQKTLSEDYSNDEEFWKSFDRNTDIVFQIMKAKRERYETEGAKRDSDMERVEKVESRLIGKATTKEDLF